MVDTPDEKQNRRLVLIDASCASFQIEAIANKQKDPWQSLSDLIDCYDKNGGLINRDSHEEISVIWCFDSKAQYHCGRGYWRHEYLITEGIKYKPNRPANPGIDKIKLAIQNRVPLERQARQLSFEADDIIANLTLQYSEHPIDIITVDTDLLQLVSDRIRWVNTARYAPIIRYPTDVRNYALKTWNTVILSPREIVDVKVKYGDRSDGLPPGINRGYIDLYNPLVKCPYWHSFDLQFWNPSGNTTGIEYDSPASPILHSQNKSRNHFILGSSKAG